MNNDNNNYNNTQNNINNLGNTTNNVLPNQNIETLYSVNEQNNVPSNISEKTAYVKQKNKSSNTILIIIVIGLIIGGYFIFFKEKKTIKSSKNSNNEAASLFNKDLHVSPQVLIDDEYMKYEITKFELNTKLKGHEKYIVHVKFTNKLDQDVKFTHYITYINNIKYLKLPNESSINTIVKAHGSIEDKYEINTNYINNEIEYIKDIESFTIDITISTSGSTRIFDNKTVDVQTTGAKIKQDYNFGKIIFSDDKIDVYFIDVQKDIDHNSDSYADVNILIHNKSNEVVMLWPTDFKIYFNSVEASTSMNTETSPGKYSIDTLWSTYDKDIKSINKIGFGLTYFKEDENYHPYKESFTRFIEFETK